MLGEGKGQRGRDKGTDGNIISDLIKLFLIIPELALSIGMLSTDSVPSLLKFPLYFCEQSESLPEAE